MKIMNKIENLLKNNKRVVIAAVGDSITYGMDHCSPDETYIAILAKLFADRFQEHKVVRYDGIPNGVYNPLSGYSENIVQDGKSPELIFVRSGVGGNSVKRALNRSGDFIPYFAEKFKSDVILIMFGINDSIHVESKFATPSEFYNNLMELYSSLKLSHQDSIFCFMTPTYNDFGESTVSSLDPYSDMVKKAAAETGSYLIDTHSLWMDHLEIGAYNYGQKDWLSGKEGDMCHFSPTGSYETAKFIFENMNSF